MYKVKDLNGYHRFSGRSKARVIDNRDPFSRGYIRVDHPTTGPTAWIPYLKTPGFFDVPSIGDVVYLEADSGHGQYPIAWGNITKGIKGDNDTPEQFKREVPTNRGIYTPDGHTLEFDDGIQVPTQDPNTNTVTTQKRGVRLTTSSGNKIHIIEDDDADVRQILIEDINGNLFRIDTASNTITINSKLDMQQIVDNDLLETTLNDKSVVVSNNETVNVGNNKTDTIGGNLTINVTGNVNVEAGGTATVKSGGAATIDAGGNITLKSANNVAAPGGVVTDNTINNDPITGIPLVGVGGTDAN